MKKSDCIKAVQLAGASATEAREIVEMMIEQARTLKQDGKGTAKDLSEAWDATTQAMQRAAQERERRTTIGLIKYAEMKARIDNIKAQGISAIDAIQANLVGISKHFNGARDSISAQRYGILDSWLAPLMREIESIDNGAAITMIRNDKAFHDDVIREMREPGSTTNKSAAKVATAFANTLENTRQRLNAAGADIGRLEGWAPQTHDPDKLLAGGEAGRQKWIDFMMENLDHERTFDGVGLVDSNKAREVLNGVYDTLTLGKNPHLSEEFSGGGSTVSGPRNLATSFGQSRVLHFKDAEAAIRYNDLYGRGNVFDAMLYRLEQDARALSLMDRLGPSPDYTLKKLVEREKAAIREDQNMAQEVKRKELEKLNRALTTGSIGGGKINNWMAELTGETTWSVNRTMAKVGSFARATQNLSKLGAATLSAIADVFIKASSIRANSNQTWVEALARSVFQYFQGYSGDKKEMARQCGVFLDNVSGSIASRWDVNEGIGKTMSRLQDLMFKWSGLNFITERGKAGYSLWLSGHLGEASGKSFDQLDGPRRAMLEYHGIGPEKWDLMRKMVGKAEDGRAYFTPEGVEHLTDADLAVLIPERFRQYSEESGITKEQWAALRAQEIENARHKLRFEAMAFMVDETRFAIIMPDDATLAVMRQGTRPGTAAGEFWRAAMQFKSFPIAYMQRVLGGRRWIRGDRQDGQRYGFNAGSVKDVFFRDMPGFVGFVISSLAFGYAAMTAKDIAKGRSPRDITRPETMLAAAVQSGGLGIFGDIFFGKVNRFGNTLAETAFGPLGDLLGKVGTIGGELVRGDFQEAGTDTLNTAISNAPMINLWYTRAALDWLLLYHIKEWQSPGYLRKAEKRMLKDFNQTFLVSPADKIKRGGFWFK